MLPGNFGVCRVCIFHTTKHEASFALLDFLLEHSCYGFNCVHLLMPTQKMCAILPSPSVPPKRAEILAMISQNVTLLRG